MYLNFFCIFLASINHQLIDDLQPHQPNLQQLPNWRGGKQNKNVGDTAAAVSDGSIYMDSDINVVARQDDTLIPMYALLTLTLFVFALFINWFCKLRRSSSGSNSSSSGGISNSRFKRRNILFNLFGFK